MRLRRSAAPGIDLPQMAAEMGRFSTRSVRFRVTALATAIVALILVTVAVALIVVQQRTLTATVDDGLRRRANDLALLIVGAVPESLAGADDDNAAQIVTPDGTVLASSPNVSAGQPIAADPGELEVVEEVNLASHDDSFRVLSRSAATPDGRVVIHVATAADDISDSVEILRNSLLVVIPLSIGLLAAAIWWLVGRALGPVDAIRAEVTSISQTDLDRRVPVPETDDEISRLAVTMNSMLDRLEDGVARLQRFVADASHELRSPLTRMRSELEVDLANPADSDPAATHRSVLEEVVAMERLVDDLLHLARVDAGHLDRRVERVDLDDLLLAEADRLRANGAAVDVAMVSAGQVSGNRVQLMRAIRNLADNAARHAASTVRFELKEDDGWVSMAVCDDGSGVPPQELERIFERFARADEGRSRSEGGTGLGLAIVRDVIERHGGTVTVDAGQPDGARFVVRLPTGAVNPREQRR